MTTLGYVITGVLWLVVLIPLGKALWTIIRTTRPSDLKPRVTVRRVPDCHGARMVSRQRALMEPDLFVPVTRWCWRRRA